MVRISKMVEYSILLLTNLVTLEGNETMSAREISDKCNIPLPTVSKILKQLAKKGIVESIQGSKGGYHIAKNRDEINLKMLIETFDGNTNLVTCSLVTKEGICNYSNACIVKNVMVNLDWEINELFR